MKPSEPKPITAAELAARKRRASLIARRIGFVGRVEYRHVRGQTGGAQFGLAATPDRDLLVIDAEAFERDADPDDFSLEAMIAHERGHQLLARHPQLVRNLPRNWSAASDEIVASILGCELVTLVSDRNDLLSKALYDATEIGIDAGRAVLLIADVNLLTERIR